jgi:hypothetical protein
MVRDGDAEALLEHLRVTSAARGQWQMNHPRAPSR